MSYISYFTAAPLNNSPDTTLGRPSFEGVRVWRSYVGYSRLNINLRNQITGDITTYYHGKTDVRTLFDRVVTSNINDGETNCLIDLNEQVNNIQYNIDYSLMNDYTQGVIYNPLITNETIFPNTVIFSPVQSEEGMTSSWRTFLSGDRYVLAKHKGQIINLQGYHTPICKLQIYQ